VKITQKKNPAAIERSMYGVTAQEVAQALIASGPDAYRDLDPTAVADRGRLNVSVGYNPWRAAALGYAITTAERDGVRGLSVIARANATYPAAEEFARRRPGLVGDAIRPYAYRLTGRDVPQSRGQRFRCVSEWFCATPVEFDSLEEFCAGGFRVRAGGQRRDRAYPLLRRPG